MTKIIVVNQELCNGCQLCQLACHLAKTGEAGLAASRIRVAHPPAGGGLVSVCSHCEEPMCVTACLMEAISKTAAGTVVRREESCIGCQSCVVMCPWDGCQHDFRQDVAVSCDLCGGEPRCIKFCPTGALTFAVPEQVSRDKRTAAARRFAVDGGKGGWPWRAGQARY